MNSDDLGRTIVDYREISLRQLFDVLTRIKLGVLFSLLAAFTGYSFLMFQLGQSFQQEETALTLLLPFDMNIQLAERQIKLENVYLAIDEQAPVLNDNHTVFQVRRIGESAMDTETVGRILAQKTHLKPVPWRIRLSALADVHAQAFQWEGHERNLRFREVLVKQNTIRRYYEDGWILEYNVDDRGRSIPSSFRWIRRG